MDEFEIDEARLQRVPGDLMSGHESDEEEVKPGKRKSFPASDAVSMKTLMRWKVTQAVNVDQIMGFCCEAAPEDREKAEELLQKTGLLVCLLCLNR